MTSEWKGLPATEPLPDCPTEIRLVALPGHTTGHSGVAIATDNGWILHAGDAYMGRGAIDPTISMPEAQVKIERALAKDRSAREESLQHLRRLLHSPDVTIISAHDPSEF